MERLIFHVDVNSAFLSWEAVRRVKNGDADLRLVPSCIGGDPNTRRGVVLAKSIPAKQFGVKTGEPLSAALRKCPGLIIAPPDFRLYAAQSRAFKAICREYTSIVEEFSIDECFLDLSGTERVYPDPIALAHTIKDRIKDELGFTVNIGVGRTKLCAKMASDFEKPDRVHTLFPGELSEKLWPLPAGELLYVGRATADKLNRVGIRTIGELAKADPAWLRPLLGEKTAAQAIAYANGIDASPVRDAPEEAKGYSNSITLEEDVTTFEQAYPILLALSDSATERMRRDGARAYGVSVTVRYFDFQNRSHQCKLPAPTDSASEVYATAKRLLGELWKDRRPLRLLAVSLGNLTRAPAAQQLSLLDERDAAAREKAERLDKAVSGIRARFGFDAIGRAALLGRGNDVGKKFRGRDEAEREKDE